ncbi:venom carboxylesterase-6-like isoform X2 [Limulus polyphemus]|uniref:Venom carboxylesterase-6-like isoform X2 n=1 Tax=Limulus polyphemus TaxID=6850 RepID=A0ABM1SFM4_LIMPO|nr:venom carboxylesterase-6-like isoform X2 [Limulus polyphemus]
MRTISLSGVFLLILYPLSRLCAAEEKLVQTSKGTIRGMKVKRASLSSRDIYSFVGIPYAKPPVGKLRFKPPEEMEFWSGVRDTTDNKMFCPQIQKYTVSKGSYTGVEDCLYLNVYTSQDPANLNSNTKSIPVLVYVHGGEFQNGGKDEVGPQFLLDKSMVLVVVNYRLGILGFLSTDDDEAPGNNGLKDQFLALKWVKENIAKFGGDPNKVTIYGHDAGAASVSFHMVSELTKGYFHRAITSSGSGFAPWALINGSREYAVKVARYFQCPVDDNQMMVDCLQDKTAQQLVTSQVQIQNVTFLPTIEKNADEAFLVHHPKEAYEQGRAHKVPLISSVTGNEGSLKYYSLLEEVRKQNSSRYIIEFLLKPHFKYDDDLVTVISAAKYYYLGDTNFNDWTASSPKLIEAGNPTWMYVFNYFGERSLRSVVSENGVTTTDYGVAHYDDMFYVFNTSYDNSFPNYPRIVNSDKNTLRVLINCIYNFMETGEITKQYPAGEWKKFTVDNLAFFNFSNTYPQYTTQYGYRQSAVRFWNVLVPELLEIEASRPTPSTLSPEELANINSEYKQAATVLAVFVAVVVLVCLGILGFVYNSRKKIKYMSASSVPNPQK